MSSATLLLAATLAAAQTPVDSAHTSDPRAIAIADEVMTALGGRDRWDRLVGLRWSFESARNDTMRSSRRHSWNKHTGWHRVSGKTRDGADFLFVHRIYSDEGRAWMAGNAIEGDSLKTLMKRANSLWTNDTYWMLMPYKLRDPGVTLKYVDAVRDGDYIWDKVALSFDKVGETPGDHYWIYVNRATRRIDKWEFVLQGESPPPNLWTWEGWEEHGGLWFPTIHRGADGRAIFTRNVETISEFPAAEFAQP